MSELRSLYPRLGEWDVVLTSLSSSSPLVGLALMKSEEHKVSIDTEKATILDAAGLDIPAEELEKFVNWLREVRTKSAEREKRDLERRLAEAEEKVTSLRRELTGVEDVSLSPPKKTHPRDGYAVALYLGQHVGPTPRQILVEVYETYNRWGDERSKSWHYKPYDLLEGKKLEIKTIGFIGPPPESGEAPPVFVQGQFKDYNWTRLR